MIFEIEKHLVSHMKTRYLCYYTLPILHTYEYVLHTCTKQIDKYDLNYYFKRKEHFKRHIYFNMYDIFWYEY